MPEQIAGDHDSVVKDAPPIGLTVGDEILHESGDGSTLRRASRRAPIRNCNGFIGGAMLQTVQRCFIIGGALNMFREAKIQKDSTRSKFVGMERELLR